MGTACSGNLPPIKILSSFWLILNAARYQLQKSFGRRISLAHSDSSKVKENGNAVQPEKETQINTTRLTGGVDLLKLLWRALKIT